MNDKKRGQRRLVVIVIVLGLLFLIWQLALRTPLVKVSVPAGADRVELRSVVTDRVVVNTSKGQSSRLASGTYTAVSFKGAQAVGAQMVHIGKGLRHTLDLNGASEPSSQLSTTLHQRTDKLTRLGDGYLYINRQTRAVEYATPGSIQNVSSLFDVSNTQSLDITTLNTVINIEPGKNGQVLVTTTSSVFIVKDLANIVRMPAYDKEFLNFTSSAYDPGTNRLFLLSAHSSSIYYYDLGRTDDGPKVLYNSKLEVNRLVAGGGSVIAYFDDLPSLGSTEVEAYGLTRQLAPLVINASSGKLRHTLDQFVGATQISISGSGKLMAVKKKFATTMTVSSLSGDNSRAVLAADTGGVAWQNDDLYIARDQALWLFKPSENAAKLQLVALTGRPVRQVTTTADEVYVSDTSGFTSKAVPKSAAVSQQLGNKLSKLVLATSGYYVSYVSEGAKAAVVVETKGTFVPGVEEATLRASQTAQLQDAKTALGAYANDPAVTITHQDGSIISRYIYTGIPSDE